MKIRQIMDCLFITCSLKDTVHTVEEKMVSHKVLFIIVVDDNNIYKGIITADSLLKYNGDRNKAAAGLVQEVTPVMENEHILSLKSLDNVVPVINTERNVMGVITLKSLLEYLPEVIGTCEDQSSGGRKDIRQNSKYTIDDIIGQSTHILHLKERVIAAAKTKSTVLILGETGTGKELVAHAIHRLSSRRHQPFVRINCAAIPENLLESELFGYEQGAFTGAIKGGHPGKFQVADGGTIFLDEIGDMPLSLQAKILRVLQEREIEKIGGRFPIPVDVRIIAATHCNLLELVKANKFRQDLYYRLHVIPIQMPPLRAHREDIPLLVDYFLGKLADEFNMEKPKVEREFMKALYDYHWPGNVRELVNVLEMAVSLSNGVITREHIPMHILEQQSGLNDRNEESAGLRAHADEAEREAILKAMEMYRGNKIKVAEALGISRSSLYNKMKRYNIQV